ncbi:hypothetical protein QZH41_002783 [Actinostola sp. cb2023]|nr:hypothetical protein QZH41_002783 [Actinostola sp. cb2023]
MDENKRVVCFDPDKRDQLKDKEASKTPVRLLSLSPQKRNNLVSSSSSSSCHAKFLDGICNTTVISNATVIGNATVICNTTVISNAIVNISGFIIMART